MPEIGYKLSSEEHAPADLVRYALRAEEDVPDLPHAPGPSSPRPRPSW